MCLLFLVLPHDCVKTSRKTPLSPHLQPNCFEREHYSSFCVVLPLSWTNGFNTFEQFVQKAQRSCSFFPCLLPIRQPNNSKKEEEKKQFIRRTLEATKTRDQNLFWFSGNLLHAMPSRAEPYQDIALSSFRTRWIIRRLLLGQIKRRFVARQIFSFSNEKEDETKIAIKKYPAKDTHSPIQLLFFSNMRLDFPLHDCYDFKRALPHFGNRIGMNIETKHNSKQENPCHFATISFERISW